jgi:stage V sporulation protein SpoVS
VLDHRQRQEELTESIQVWDPLPCASAVAAAVLKEEPRQVIQAVQAAAVLTRNKTVEALQVVKATQAVKVHLMAVQVAAVAVKVQPAQRLLTLRLTLRDLAE